MVAVKIPDDVLKERNRKLEAKICLVCDRPLKTIPGTPKRGCCARCYQRILRAKQQGKTDEKRLVKEGRILPTTESKLGRRPIDEKVRGIIEG